MATQGQSVLSPIPWTGKTSGGAGSLLRQPLAWAVAGGVVALALWMAREPIAELAHLLQDQQTVRDTIQSYGAWGPLALAAAQVLQILVAFLPGHILTIAAGYAYGFGGGLILNVVTAVFASQLAFLLARKAGRPLVDRLVAPDTVSRIDDMAARHGSLFFLVSFLIPVFPADVMNLVAGLSSISALRFLAVSLLGRLPIAVLLTLVGSHGLHFPPYVWPVLGIALVVAAFIWVSCGRRHRL